MKKPNGYAVIGLGSVLYCDRRSLWLRKTRGTLFPTKKLAQAAIDMSIRYRTAKGYSIINIADDIIPIYALEATE